VIWRSAVIAGYVALAAVVTVAYGARGLATLLFFYFCAGSWVAFVVAWGWAARAAARWRFRDFSGVR
jgi:cation transporter-like permease